MSGKDLASGSGNLVAATPPTWKEQSVFVWQRAIASDLKVQTFILAVSHSASKYPTASGRSPSGETNKTMSSAKTEINSEVPKLDTALRQTVPRDQAHEYYKQDRTQDNVSRVRHPLGTHLTCRARSSGRLITTALYPIPPQNPHSHRPSKNQQKCKLSEQTSMTHQTDLQE